MAVSLYWDEDGVVLRCDRPECMVTVSGRQFWWTEKVPFLAAPEVAVEQASRHLATHGGA